MEVLKIKRTVLMEALRVVKSVFNYKFVLIPCNEVCIRDGYVISKNDTFSIAYPLMEDGILMDTGRTRVLPAVEFLAFVSNADTDYIEISGSVDTIIVSGNVSSEYSKIRIEDKVINSLYRIPESVIQIKGETKAAIIECKKTTTDLNRAYKNVKWNEKGFISTDSYRITKCELETGVPEPIYLYEPILPILEKHNITGFTRLGPDLVLQLENGAYLYSSIPDTEFEDLEEFIFTDTDAVVVFEQDKKDRHKFRVLNGIVKDTVVLDRLCKVTITENLIAITAKGSGNKIAIKKDAKFDGEKFEFLINVNFLQQALDFAEVLEYNNTEKAVIFHKDNIKVYIWIEGV